MFKVLQLSEVGQQLQGAENTVSTFMRLKKESTLKTKGPSHGTEISAPMDCARRLVNLFKS